AISVAPGPAYQAEAATASRNNSRTLRTSDSWKRSASVRAIATEAMAKQCRRTAEEANRESNFDCAIEIIPLDSIASYRCLAQEAVLTGAALRRCCHHSPPNTVIPLGLVRH